MQRRGDLPVRWTQRKNVLPLSIVLSPRPIYITEGTNPCQRRNTQFLSEVAWETP
jgi:hypothetical protein